MKYHYPLKIIVLIALMGLIITPITNAALLTSSVAPSSIFRCQPATISATFNGIEPVADAFTDQNQPNSNIGYASYVAIFGANPWRQYGYVNFSLPSTNVSSAVLNLTGDHPGVSSITLQRVTSAWTETGITWNTAPTTTTTNQVTVSINGFVINQSIEITVTQLVNDMITNGNYGFAVVPSFAASDWDFYSRTGAHPPRLNLGNSITVSALVSSEVPVLPGWQNNSNTFTTQTTTVPMTFNGTHWTGVFGNDANLLWGRRTISYQINNGIIYSSSSRILVYSDVCTGTGITNYTQLNSGLGNYTNRLFNGQYDFIGSSLDNSIIGWSIYPFIQIWGYLFYLLVIFTIVTTVYLKSQNIMQPLIIAIFLFLVFAGTSVIDPVYRQWIVFLIGVSLAGIYYKIFMRE